MDLYSNIFNTYKEAELACLRKLIEIAKSKQNMTQQEFTEWGDDVKAFVKEKQMTEEVQKEFLEEYDSHLFRGGLEDVEWYYNELYGGNK